MGGFVFKIDPARTKFAVTPGLRYGLFSRNNFPFIPKTSSGSYGGLSADLFKFKKHMRVETPPA